MKDSRHAAILEIISDRDVETQEELARELEARGFKVTQATISRDIKELHLIKIQTEDGVYKYANNETVSAHNTERLLRVFRETLVSIQYTGNLVVVNTLPGSAHAAAEVVDNIEVEGVVGSIAGDNTFFIAVKEGTAEAVVQYLRQMAR